LQFFVEKCICLAQKNWTYKRELLKETLPPEDSLDSATGPISNNADLISLAEIQYVVKRFCQIATAMYHGVKSNRAKRINHFAIDEVLLDLVKGVARSYIEVIEAIEDCESLKAMGEIAFRLIIKYMMKKDVLAASSAQTTDASYFSQVQ
jgi:hypothetical protein